MNIKVVLTENDPKLGKRGDVVQVSPGYAQNFLFPHHKAKPATPLNLKGFEQEKTRLEKEEAVRLEKARALGARISSASLMIEVLVGEGEKMYGAVTSQDIIETLSQQGILLEKKDIHLEEPIKKLGIHQVPVKLHKDVLIQLKLSVAKKTSS